MLQDETLKEMKDMKTEQKKMEDSMVTMVSWARVHRERDTHAIEVQIMDVWTSQATDATTCRQCTLITVEVLIDMILVLEVLVDSIHAHEVPIDTRGSLEVLIDTSDAHEVPVNMIDCLEVPGDSIDAHGVPIDMIDGLEALAELQGTTETTVGPNHLVIHMFCQRTMRQSLQTMAESENTQSGNLHFVPQRAAVTAIMEQMKWVTPKVNKQVCRLRLLRQQFYTRCRYLYHHHNRLF
jgi:hypothetical protein